MDALIKYDSEKTYSVILYTLIRNEADFDFL